MPTASPPQRALPRTILLATDLSSRCDRAQDRAILLAKGWAARLCILHVMPVEEPADLPSWRRDRSGAAARAEQQIRADLEGCGTECDVMLARGEAAETILAQAEAMDAGLLVTGVARDDMLGRATLGAIVDRLVSHAPMPVLVVKGRPRGAYGEILVATDFSESSRQALQAALHLFPAARITLFHAFQVPFEGFISRDANMQEMRDQAAAELDDFLRHVQGPADWRDRVTPLLEYGQAGALICDYVQARGIPLVVIGTQGRSGLASFLVGSTAKRLLAALPCDTMTLRQHG
ncbi:universal stress protein [Roseomonas frigidaquae]|uniref:Universal stress protein n=1 Tax=Falsiroseomonas frigidaquae TaxID=487318 RepID=A0ABX1EUD2_9PROT|nr:universal stress protein [Falsiroseomonas frigidaquae]NKE44230.1 universal stress protein [Falsiroseomonas frigidaquae]